MSAAKRIRHSAYIMVPGSDVSRNRELFMLGLRAARLADQRKHMHLYPQLLYSHILTDEELDLEMPRRCQFLIRKASEIWLCLYPGVSLDRVSYQLLMDNEGWLNGFQRKYWKPSRLPVYAIQDRPREAGLARRVLTREELSDLLKCNIVDGLLQGVGAAAMG